MILDVPYLQLMVAVADAGSMTRAADRLFVTQSALSHRLRTLERRLGVSLFDRVNRRLVITAAGRQVLGVARRVLTELDGVERRIRAGDPAESSTIRLVTECYTAYHWLPRVLGRVRERRPGLEVQVAPHATALPVKSLLDGTVDLAIVFTHASAERIRFHPLFEDELVLACAPDHPLAGRRHINAHDLRGEHLIVYASASGDSTVERELLRPAGVQAGRITRVQLTEAILELVKARMGVALMASWAIAPHVLVGSLAAVPITAQGMRRRWSAAVLADTEPHAGLQDVLAALTRDAFLPNGAPNF